MTGIWKLGMLEIESIVRRVASRVLTDLDGDVSKDVMKKRGEALKIMGTMFKEAGKQGKKTETHPVQNLDDLEKKANASNGKGKEKEDDEKNNDKEQETEKEKENDEKEKEKEPEAAPSGIDGLDWSRSPSPPPLLDDLEWIE